MSSSISLPVRVRTLWWGRRIGQLYFLEVLVWREKVMEEDGRIYLICMVGEVGWLLWLCVGGRWVGWWWWGCVVTAARVVTCVFGGLQQTYM